LVTWYFFYAQTLFQVIFLGIISPHPQCCPFPLAARCYFSLFSFQVETRVTQYCSGFSPPSLRRSCFPLITVFPSLPFFCFDFFWVDSLFTGEARPVFTSFFTSFFFPCSLPYPFVFLFPRNFFSFFCFRPIDCQELFYSAYFS